MCFGRPYCMQTYSPIRNYARKEKSYKCSYQLTDHGVQAIIKAYLSVIKGCNERCANGTGPRYGQKKQQGSTKWNGNRSRRFRVKFAPSKAIKVCFWSVLLKQRDLECRFKPSWSTAIGDPTLLPRIGLCWSLPSRLLLHVYYKTTKNAAWELYIY